MPVRKKSERNEAKKRSVNCEAVKEAKGGKDTEVNERALVSEEAVVCDKTVGTNEAMEETEEASRIKRNRKRRIYRSIQLIFTAGFILFTALFINEVFIQPYRSRIAIEKARELYRAQPAATMVPSLDYTDKTDGNDAVGNEMNEAIESYHPESDEASDNQFGKTDGGSHDTISPTASLIPGAAASSIKDPTMDSYGRLIQFSDLLKVNDEIKGWITITDTNIDYPVLQPSGEDPEFYLRKNIYREYDKAGSIFIDGSSSVEDNTKNIVLHGHNMTSTKNMFHQLLDYKDLDFYKKHPVIQFDTIYETGQWKIFALFVTNGTSRKEPLFDYTRSVFQDASDFLNFVYQIRIRSIYDIDVDITEDDQLLMLSTCSYELNNYRTVIVARRLREGEEAYVDVEGTRKIKKPLYPQSWYDYYKGEPPEISATFEEALDKGEIDWYMPKEQPDS